METKANYVLIGVFTLAGLLGAAGLLLWLANVQVNRQYAYYDVLFDNVAGLSTAGSVRYNGLPVGQVLSLDLDEKDPSKVRVRLEVDASTPIKTDSTAQLQSQGVTGVSYVSLSSGSADAKPMPDYGVIKGVPSPLQSIFEGAPELLTEAIDLMKELRTVVNDDNRKAVSDVLTNLASASGKLDTTLTEFETLSTDLSSAAKQIAGFTDRLDQLSDTAEQTLNAATDTLTTAKTTVQTATTTLDSATEAFDTADGLMKNQLTDFITSGTSVAKTLDQTVKTLEPAALDTLTAARTLVDTRIPAIATQVEQTVAAIETQITAVGSNTNTLIDRFEQVGETAQARLEQSEGAINSFETLSANLTSAAQEVTTFTKRLEQLSDTAETTLTTATDTLTTAQGAMTSATGTLDTAQQAFATADGLMQNELKSFITTGTDVAQTLNQTVKTLEPTVTQTLAATQELVQTRIPALTSKAETTLTNLDQQITTLGTGASGLITRYEAVGATAQARLDQTEPVITAFTDATLQAKSTIETINTSVQNNLPDLMQDLSQAASNANRVITDIGTQVTTLSGDVSALSDEGVIALKAATETFANANQTLDAITGTMGTAQNTLKTADTTLASINTVVNTDIDSIVTDVRDAVSTFSTTVQRVSANLDRISSEILNASTSASNLIGTVDGIVQSNRRQLSDFLRVGLPQLQRFVDESRRLVNSMDRLVDRVERDPARFFLGTQASEFRK